MSALRLIGRLGYALLLVAAVLLARAAPVRASSVTPAWAGPVTIVQQPNGASSPALAFTGDGVGHAVWASSDGWLMYASRPVDGPWSAPIHVFMGNEPSLAVTGDNTLHLLFRAQVFGNYEIYYASESNGQWSLPINVSHTSNGLSDQPVLLASLDGQLHAAWRDDTPGYPVIYYAVWDGVFWNSQPIANARGEAPALAAAPDGTVFVAWQDAAISGEATSFDIWLGQRAPGSRAWSAPVDVSDSPSVDSVGATLVSAADGLAHIAWVDNGQILYYAFGRGYTWSAPLQRAAGTVVEQPHLAVEAGTIMHLAWHQDQAIEASQGMPTAAQWPDPSVVSASKDAALKDVDLVTIPEGGAAVTWVASLANGQTTIYESVRAPALGSNLWLPILTR